MSAPLAIQPVLTAAGIAAATAAANHGLHAEITEFGFGSGLYTPLSTQTELVTEVIRAPVLRFANEIENTLSIEAALEDHAAFDLGEIGLFLDDGTLFAVWSDPDAHLMSLVPGIALNLRLELTLQEQVFNSITVAAPTVDTSVLAALLQLLAGQARIVTRQLEKEGL